MDKPKESNDGINGKRRYTIADAVALAASRGGECLSSEVRTTKDRLRWRCQVGHIWETPFRYVIAGRWCRECVFDSLRAEIEEIRELVVPRGGKLLSNEYKNTDTKLRWECSKGHQWWATANKIKQGRWCPHCAGKYKTIEYYRNLAASRGGLCNSPKYVSSTSPLEWQCERGHVWNARPSNIQSGTWCPYCLGRRPTIEDMKSLARFRGGECISNEYSSAQDKLLWKCKDGHTWEAIPNSIQQGTWCPQCHVNYGEEMCREYLEALLGKPFPKCRPPFLVFGPHRRLELDGYCEELQIAFEHHGTQHYTRCKHFHREDSDFLRQRERDKLKQDTCRAVGVTLIEIPAVPNLISVEALPSEITRLLRDAGVSPSLFRDPVAVDFSDVYNRSALERLHVIAKSHGGQLLSDVYLGSETKLLWRCANGHEWEARPANVKLGTWCALCYGNVRKTLDDIRSMASAKGIQLLSDEYHGNKSKLRWRCPKGHEWSASPQKVVHETGCPKCAGRGMGIADMQAISLSDFKIH